MCDFCFGSFDAKDTPHTGRRTVENGDIIISIIEVDLHTSSLAIIQELKFPNQFFTILIKVDV